ncbi:MAG: DUF5928 domain-containing protein [Paracoccaceae bacterium]
MAKICFLLLCHKNPELVVKQVNLLTSVGDFVAVHLDGRVARADFLALKSALADNPNVSFAKRVKCGWGEWSLVQGSLNALRAGYAAFPEASHFYMLSGDCMPIKPVGHMHDFLDHSGKDYIEHHDFFESDWIKVGFKEQRLIYRHWFNERSNKALFYLSAGAQKTLGMARGLPKNLQIMIGSQWWCLRRSTITKLFELLKSRPDIPRFFKTTWIPDETFFQTLVLHLVPRDEVESRTLTFLAFSDYGIPTVFYGDHLNFLLTQDYLFARKISDNATNLKTALSEEYHSDRTVNIGPEGKRLIAYLNSRGRGGQRFNERFWERGSRVGRNNTLQIILCKKWHVGKRFADIFADACGIPSLGYVFDEQNPELPDLGGVERTHIKRNRHRRAFLKLLFEHLNINRLVICMDPSNLETLRDFAGDRCELRVLNMDCILDDAFLGGHAQRIGLSDSQPNAALIATLRNNIRADREALQDIGLTALSSITETSGFDANASALAEFLKIPQNHADEIAQSLSFE